MRQTILAILLVVLIAVTGFIWIRYLREAPAASPPSDAAEREKRGEPYR